MELRPRARALVTIMIGLSLLSIGLVLNQIAHILSLMNH